MPAPSGHPAFSVKDFWIPAFAGMTNLERKNFPTPDLFMDSY
jgi:hypothetical protein